MPSQSHDSLFKAIFGRPAHAAPLLRSVIAAQLSAELAAAIQWPTLTLRPASFVDQRLRKSHSDLLFSVQCYGQELLIYTLLEHQSTNDEYMPLRVYHYEGHVYDGFRADKCPFAPIICVVFSHARPHWTGSAAFCDLFHPAVREHPELLQFVPNFRILIEDISNRSDEAIAALQLPSFPTVLLWMFRDTHDEETLWLGLVAWAEPVLDVLSSPEDARLFMAYFMARTEKTYSPKRFHDTLARMGPDAQDKLMNILDLWEGKGLERGLEQGLTRGRIDVLTKQLSRKFGEVPAPVHERLTNAGIPQLDAWAERLLVANTLDEVFAD